MIALTANRLLRSEPQRGAGYGIEHVKKPVGIFEFGAKVTRFGANEPLFREGEPARYIYKVMDGVVRSYKLLRDGHRKIGAFRLPRDLFGVDGGHAHESSADAITDVTVLVGRRDTLIARAAVDCDVSQQLLAVTTRELQRVQRHALLLAMHAPQRLARFLMEMSIRRGQPVVVELPMSRQDIADYLGLTIETVSRAMTQFEAASLIELRTAREVVLRDRPELRRMSE